MPLPSGLVTFAFTDIEGSTALFQRLGDRFPEVVERHRALVLGPCLSAGGYLVKSEGDGLFLAFDDTAPALAALAQVQRDLAEASWPDDITVRVRVGVHAGEARPIGDDYIALAVHEAARVARSAHGGQVIVSDAAVPAALPHGLALRRLGRYRLRDLDEPMVLHQLHGDGLAADFPAVRALPEAAHNIALPATPLIGRERDVAQLRKRLAADRLVTVVGEGGVGKSRLAVEVALAEADLRSEGAWLVEVEPLGASGLVAPTVAAATGAPMFAGRDPIDAITAQLGTGDALVVIDGCEAGIEGVAAVVEAIRARCPRTAVLCASRVPLGIEGEHVWPAAPLGTDSVDDAAETAPAVRMFLSRASEALPGWEPRAEELAAIRAICEQLDGLPLAIELTAARVATTPLAELVNDVRAGEGAEGAVRAAYAGLGRSAQCLLRRLAVFRDGASPTAVAQVAAFEPLHESDVHDVLSVLAQRALVRQRGSGRPGVRLLEPVRQAAAKLLEEAGESDPTTQRHLRWAVEWAKDFRERASRGTLSNSTVDELANIRTALASAEQRGDSAAVMLLTEGLFSHWDTRGLFAEALVHAEWLAGSADTALAAHGAARQAQVLNKLGHFAEAEECFSAALPVLRSVGNSTLLADALSTYGNLTIQRGDPKGGLALCEEAVAIVDAADAPGVWLAVKNVEGVAHAMLGHAEESAACFAEVRERSKGTSFHALYGLAVLNLAVASFARGDLDAAEQGADEARAVFRNGFERMLPTAIRLRANVAEGRGDFARARALLEECLRQRQRLGDMPGELIDNLGIAHIARLTGDFGEAARCLTLATMSPAILPMRNALAAALDTAAHVAKLTGQAEEACRLAAAAGVITRDLPFSAADQKAHEELRAETRKALGDARADELEAEGEAWDGPNAVAAIRAAVQGLTPLRANT